MKGDFTRDTFKPEKHYRQVLMQQGRVQLDADWNEQAAIAARRDETTTADLAGDCGGPAEGAAFAVITTPAILAALPANPTTPVRQFALSAGRYYVDGIQCEVESPFLFAWQPDHRENNPLPAGRHLLYLDVWRRHLTALDDPTLRESALGGPDTATRVKTAWQVKAQPTVSAQCADAASELAGLRRAQLPQLKARTAKAQPDTDPCVLPVSAGYRGLENQLYRVEIHVPGAVDVATFKWSRENGSVATAITDFTVGPGGSVLTVASTGRDDVLGFKNGDIVELIDDSYELNGSAGKLAVIDGDPASNKIKIKPHASAVLPVSADIDLNRHPKLRRWEGLAVVSRPTTNDGYLTLESGVEILFDTDGSGYHTGDYWLIPARTASADATSGDIEWPRELDANGKPQKEKPLAQSPRGITHHYCRLGIITVLAGGALDDTAIQDCRCLWPALTTVPRLFYVSGDGQEVMPDLTAPAGTLFKLPRPLIVGVANAHCPDRAFSVQFEVVSPSSGLVVATVPGGAPTLAKVTVPLDTEGLAKCDFHLDGIHPVQQVTARLLDANDVPVSLPLIFNANLSIAREVAYDPAGCAGLAPVRNVQDAVARLASSVRLEKISGDGQDAEPGAKLGLPVKVAVMSKCGPVPGATVRFVVNGGGAVTATQDEGGGVYSCGWTLAADPATQELTAILAAVPGVPAPLIETPNAVGFTANVRTAGHGTCCCLTVGPGGDFHTLEKALRTLLEKSFDVCLCLLPGNHQTEDTLTFPAREGRVQTHLKISGCGRNTRLTLGGNLTFLQFGSVILRDLVIDARRFALNFAGCGAVESAGCLIEGVTNKAPLIGIKAAARVDFARNRIVAIGAGIELSPTKILRGAGNVMELYAVPNEKAFVDRAARVAAELAKSDLAAREQLIGRVAEVLRSDNSVTADETAAYRGLLQVLGVERVDPTVLLRTLLDLRDTVIRAAPGFALVQDNMRAAVTLVDNVVYGTISIGGAPFGQLFSPEEREHLAEVLKRQAGAPLMETVGVLQVHRNDFTRVTVSQEVIEEFRSMADGKRKTVDVWQSAFFSHNLIRATGQFIVAGNLAMTSNRFHSPLDPLGFSINVAAQYVFNRGENTYDLGYMNLSVLGVIKDPNAGFKVTDQ